jgi:hypothetical protein
LLTIETVHTLNSNKGGFFLFTYFLILILGILILIVMPLFLLFALFEEIRSGRNKSISNKKKRKKAKVSDAKHIIMFFCCVIFAFVIGITFFLSPFKDLPYIFTGERLSVTDVVQQIDTSGKSESIKVGNKECHRPLIGSKIKEADIKVGDTVTMECLPHTEILLEIHIIIY